MDGENPLIPWARQALIGVGLFLAGALLSFGYSYIPLHGELSWKVEQLESRLDERNRENVQLSDTIAKLKSIEVESIDPETLAQVERELEQTKRVLTQAEKDLKRSERKRKDASSNATKWQKRYKELRDAPAQMAASKPDSTEPVVTGITEATPPPTADPAAIGAPIEPTPSNASRATAESGILLPDETIAPAP